MTAKGHDMIADENPQMPDFPTPNLLDIPAEYRITIARWLVRRSMEFQPSWIFPERMTLAARDAVRGAAVDLFDPGSEDTTIDYANEILGILGLPVTAD